MEKIKVYFNNHDGAQIPDALNEFVDDQTILHGNECELIIDSENVKEKKWEERTVLHDLVISRRAKIAFFSASNVAASMKQFLEILHVGLVHFNSFVILKDGRDEIASESYLPNILSIIMDAEHDFTSTRTKKALAKRRVKGLPLGRPKGAVGKSLKLDKHKGQIKRMRAQGATISDISRIFKVSESTASRWLTLRDY